MSDSLPSWITLCGFLLPAAFFFFRHKPRKAHDMVMQLLTAVLCLLGGFVLAGGTMKLIGDMDNAILNSALVVVGAIICMGLKERFAPRGFA